MPPTRVTGIDVKDASINTSDLVDAAVTYAKLQNLDACAVLARAANSSGVPASLQLNADGKFLVRRSGALTGDVLLAADLPALNGLTDSLPALADVFPGYDGSLAANRDFILRYLTGLVAPGLSQWRLTLTSGTPVTTADVTAATSIYLEPYTGYHISLWDGSGYSTCDSVTGALKSQDAQTGTRSSTGNGIVTGLTDTSQLVVGMVATGTGINASATIASINSATQVTLSHNHTSTGTATVTFSLVANKNYDVFCYRTGTLNQFKLEWGPAWTNDTTRATALSSAYVPTRSDDNTRHYLGTARVTAVNGQLEDSGNRRLVWNYYNRVPRLIWAVNAGASWSYATATYRASNADTTVGSTRIEIVIGAATGGHDVEATITDCPQQLTNRVVLVNGLGVSSTTVNSCIQTGQTAEIGGDITMISRYLGAPGVGYFYLQHLEGGGGGGTTTWVGGARSSVLGWVRA